MKKSRSTLVKKDGKGRRGFSYSCLSHSFFSLSSPPLFQLIYFLIAKHVYMLQGILESRRGALPAVLINMLCFLFTVISNGVVSNY
jgi:hypothetical protein